MNHESYSIKRIFKIFQDGLFNINDSFSIKHHTSIKTYSLFNIYILRIVCREVTRVGGVCAVMCRWTSWMRLSWRTWWKVWNSSWIFRERKRPCRSPSESRSRSRSRVSHVLNVRFLTFLPLPGWWNGPRGKCPRIRSWTPSFWRSTRGWRPGNVWLSSHSWSFLETSVRSTSS